VAVAVGVRRCCAAAPFLGVRLPRAKDLPLIAVCGLTGMTAYQRCSLGQVRGAGRDGEPAGGHRAGSAPGSRRVPR